VSKQKIFEEANENNQCGERFAGKTIANEHAPYMCTRIKGHTGPHQWPSGERRKQEENRSSGQYTETKKGDHP
jgi:hypothetical protein|tara:strand:- start:23118 stop:23336 length:219 start_codon:yes stop_codon:yes gene_type:complete